MIINTFSKHVTLKIAKELSLDSQKQEIIEYGMIGLLSQLLSIVLLLITSYCLNMIKEMIMIAGCSAILRKYSGGAHCSSSLKCALLSMVTVPLFVYLGRFFYGLRPTTQILIVFIVGLTSLIITYVYSPKDSPSKPIKNKDMIRKLRIKSISFCIIIFFASIVLFLFNLGQISVLITLGIFSQSLTLTKLGQAYINAFDKLLNILYFERRYIHEKVC